MSTKIVPHWQKYDAAWEQAASLKERVITTLQAAAVENKFSVLAAGVIDLGEVRPLRATSHLIKTAIRSK